MAKKITEKARLEVEISKTDYERLLKNASEKGFITLSEYIRHILRNA